MEGAAAEYVQVQVENGLSGTGSGIHYHAVSFGDLMLASQFRSDTVQMPQHRLGGFIGFLNRGEVLSGYHQQVHRGLRIDVVKRKAGFILVDNSGRYFFRCDLTEQARRHEFLSLLFRRHEGLCGSVEADNKGGQLVAPQPAGQFAGLS